MFKVGQKVVCVGGVWTTAFSNNPIKNEIYTFDGYDTYTKDGDSFIFLKEFNNVSPTQGRDSYRYRLFRPIDHSFGEKLAEEIEQEIKEEQLILK